ncbi:PREDICTED: uncharacterized protein LOC109224702 [Nicotiana attenuata]|uniref:DUF241 domain protein n=1 Tax=Nicotiana attenuata TaxID=49451 RepID=A0A1J6IXI9_NICAT|nr:PREDICTED: uncharacterized protein LOC109224702 [Nicotiana attenuata]OIT05280.1 hypothetical protein A4A49_29775 [Nicotiana attenuata]
MAPSPLRSKTILKHARSSSFPSTSHPIVSQFDEHLCRVKSSSEATSSCLSSFTCKLVDLENLFDYTEDLLQLPHIQQAISLHGDELLEGYIKVLDVCATIKDLLSNEKQNKQDLLSALRRRRNMDDIISSYLTSRKKSKKMIQHTLKDLKGMMKKNVLASEEPETLAVVNMLKEVQSVTLSLFKSLLLHVNGTGSQSSSWSLLSKIVHSKTEQVEANEFDNVHAALCSKKGKFDELQHQLREMEVTIEVLEQGLECFFRRLIKTRVSLLNVLSH